MATAFGHGVGKYIDDGAERSERSRKMDGDEGGDKV